MNLMEQFADPELMHELTVGQQMAGSGITTIMGMGVTFAVLFFLWGCIAAMARFINRGGGTPPGHPLAQVSPVAAPPVAVIAAAVSAYEEHSGGFVVRKIIRSPQQNWAYAERFERKVGR